MNQNRLPSFSVVNDAPGADSSSRALHAYRQLWDRGERPDAVAFLAGRPDLEDAKAASIDIIYEEYCRRSDAGEAVDIDVFCDRFPELRGTLRQLLAVHHYLESNVDIAPRRPKSAWPTAGERFAGFQLLDELGRGGFARVYLALDPTLADRHVALKVTPEGPGEAHTLARLEHPNIVPVYQVRDDEPTGLTAICMPYHGAVTLALALANLHGDGPPPTRGNELLTAGRGRDDAVDPDRRPHGALSHGTFESAVAHLGAELADALACAHARGICHRDLKPSNILIDAAGRPLLLDFNLSSDPLAQRRRLGGTLHYMAPEQLRAIQAERAKGAIDRCSAEPDPRSDLFSLGVVLYEALTGRLPFGGELSAAEGATDAVLDRMDVAQRARPRPIRSLNSRVDGGLAGIIERCLAYDAAARPESASAVAAELRHNGSSGWARAKRWSHARPKLVGACLAAVLLIGLVTGMWAAQRDPYPVRQVQNGWAAFERGEYDLAVENFSRALEFDRKSAEALLGRARAEIAAGEFLAARHDLMAAQKLGDDGRIEALLGYCSNRLGTPSEAIPSYRRAMEMGLSNAALVNDLGYSHQKVGNLDDAQIAFDRALEINPDLAVARYNRALLAQQRFVGNGNPVEPRAIDDILRAIELLPAAADLHLDAARLLTMTHDSPSRLDEILEHVERAIELGYDPGGLSSDPFLKHWTGNARFDALSRRSPVEHEGAAVTRIVDPLLVVKR